MKAENRVGFAQIIVLRGLQEKLKRKLEVPLDRGLTVRGADTIQGSYSH